MLLNLILVPNLAKIPQSIGTIGLSCLFRRRITQQTWRDQIKEFTKKEKKIYLIEQKEKWEEISSLILRDVAAVNAIGFDCEWIYKNNKRNPVSMLQIATYSGNCVIFRLNHLQGVPSSLKEVLEDRQIIKVGVGCETDSRNLTHDYNVNLRSWMDLRHLALENNLLYSKLGLESLAKQYLGKSLNKDWKLSGSNWESRILAQRQVEYAAEDAYVGIQILLTQLSTLWDTDLEDPWENLTNKAIKEVCEPFYEIDFHYRIKHENSEIRGRLAEQDSNSSENTINVTNMSQLQAPDGNFLSYCNNKKAHWYVQKGLGDKVSESPFIVKLKFDLSAKILTERIYRNDLLQLPQNCLICGKQDSYIFKNIIPFKYRKHFPEFLFSQIFDVVIFCNECFKTSNSKDLELSQKLAEECDSPSGPEINDKITRNDRINMIRNAGKALRENRNELPLQQIHNLEKTLKNYFETDTLTEDLITQAASVHQTSQIDYIHHSYKVFKYYEKIGLIHLETLCRQWFLDSMKPKFMPEIWSVSHNVQWLKIQMSHLPLDDVNREDYKIALVGKEGYIDVPYQKMEEVITKKDSINNTYLKQKIDQTSLKR